MTHVMRLLVISALAAGTSWVMAQDDSLDALLLDLGAIEEVTPEPEGEQPVGIADDSEAIDAADAPAPAIEAVEDEEEADDISPVEATPAEGTAPEMTPGIAISPDLPLEVRANIEELAALEKLTKDMIARHGMDALTLADKAFKAQQYEEAIQKYLEAEDFFTQANIDELLSKRDVIRQSIRESYFQMARTLRKAKYLEEALDAAKKAQANGHPNAARLVADLEKQIQTAPIEEKTARPSIRNSPAAIAEREVIKDRLQDASVLLALGKLDEAREKVEMVLATDLHNRQAITLRQRIAGHSLILDEEIRKGTHDIMIDQVTRNWTPTGLFPREETTKRIQDITTSNSPTAVEGARKQRPEDVIKDKLSSITIPEVKFQPPATIADAVDFFNQVSVTYDKPELPIDQRGVNIVLKLSGSTPAPAAEADPFGGIMGGGASSSGLPEITPIRMRYVSLKEALDMVCEVTGMKYNIRGNTIMIIPRHQSMDELETRSYNVMSSFVDRIQTLQPELSSVGGLSGSSGAFGVTGGGSSYGGGSGFGGGASDVSATDSIKDFFTQMGVPWPDGSSVAYLSAIGKLRVTNTAENLAAFEAALTELNVTPFQVEVEARFVEVSQTDLNSLGFEWALNKNFTGTIGNGLNWQHLGNPSSAGGGIFDPTIGSGTKFNNIGVAAEGFNQGMRFMGDAGTLANRVNLGGSALPVDDRFAMISGVFGELDISMILHMLSQRSDTDLLSSPKVVARPGQEAVMKVVTEYIYPTEFEVTQLNNNNSGSGNSTTNVTVPFAVEPQNFEMREVGVILQVVPEVSAEGQMINLVVNPQVVELREWKNYGMKIPYTPTMPTTQFSIADVTGLTDLMNAVSEQEVRYTELDMPQPFFHVRSVSTYLSVYNGATVVMGGMINEVRKSIDDKIPILGDLPFIGFLFRSKAEYSDKRNLLIFLTARLVDPAGKTVRTAVEADAITGTTASNN